MFSQVCVSIHPGRGVSQSQVLSQVTGPRSFLGLYPSPAKSQSQVLSQVLSGVVPQSCKVPVPGSFPGPFWGCTPVLQSGVPQVRMGYPQPGLGYFPPPFPTRQNSRASTCCTAGVMPLAVTQEDFLVM